VGVEDILKSTKTQEQEKTIQKPEVRGFRINAKRVSRAEDLIKQLSQISFISYTIDPNDSKTIIALNVEARDISNNPYNFSIIYFKPNEIDVIYTITPKKSSKLRKLEVLSYVLNILSFCADIYSIKIEQLAQITENILLDATEYFSMDYQELYTKYDRLKEENEGLNKKIKMVEDSKKELENEVYTLKNKMQELNAKLQGLEKYSDDVLALKIQEWIAEHNGEFNLAEFAKIYNVPETRVEQILNNLIAEGYLEGSKG
jgi:hypothetical protein